LKIIDFLGSDWQIRDQKRGFGFNPA